MAFRKYCCNTMFSQISEQLTDKLHAVKTKDVANRVQTLEFTQIKKNAKPINSKF